MIVGETCVVVHSETAAAAYTLSGSDVTIEVLDPNRNAITPAPSPTVVPGSSSTVQSIEALIHPTIGGQYRLTWTINVGSSILKRKEVYFAAWTDIYTFLRTRLQKSATDLPDAEIDTEYAITVRSIQGSLPVIGAYGNLLNDDQDNFDTAAALITALKMNRYKPPSIAGGVITQYRQQTSQWTFEHPEMDKNPSNTFAGWYNEAVNALQQVSTVASLYAQRRAGFRKFRISGPTRQAKGLYQSQSLFTIMAGLLTYDYIGSVPAIPLIGD